jgi:hypothetical protein
LLTGCTEHREQLVAVETDHVGHLEGRPSHASSPGYVFAGSARRSSGLLIPCSRSTETCK